VRETASTLPRRADRSASACRLSRRQSSSGLILDRGVDRLGRRLRWIGDFCFTCSTLTVSAATPVILSARLVRLRQRKSLTVAVDVASICLRNLVSASSAGSASRHRASSACHRSRPADFRATARPPGGHAGCGAHGLQRPARSSASRAAVGAFGASTLDLRGPRASSPPALDPHRPSPMSRVIFHRPKREPLRERPTRRMRTLPRNAEKMPSTCSGRAMA